MMKVILKVDVDGLGRLGEVVSVKDGYARNYLIPRGLAFKETKGNLRIYEEMKKKEALKLNRDLRASRRMAEAIEKASVTIPVPVGEEDRMFGAVIPQTISEALAEQGFQVDRKKIELEEPIKALGVYTVPIKIHPQVEAKVKVWVVKE